MVPLNKNDGINKYPWIQLGLIYVNQCPHLLKQGQHWNWYLGWGSHFLCFLYWLIPS